MSQTFDLIVIGTGSAGSTVAIVDSRPFGGTCALRGCDPKKVLVGASDVVDWSRRMEAKGLLLGDLQIAWPALMRFKKSFTGPVPKKREDGFAKAGIGAFHGRVQFMGPEKIQVNGEVLEGSRIVIAAGAKPKTLGIPGEDYLTTSDQFLDLETLPQRILFIGGGYISMEFAHVAARVSANVTVLHSGENILPAFDPDLAAQLTDWTRHLGINIRLQTTANAVEKAGDHFKVVASRQGETQVFEADMIVHGAGRVPDIDDMNLQAAHVERGEGGVKVNQYLQSVSNENIYAAGDAAATDGLPLTPVAGYEGKVVAANLLKSNSVTPDYRGIPSVAFTSPPVASVGISEKAACEQRLDFEKNYSQTSAWYTSRRIAETCSGFKVLIEKGSGHILGAHLLGSHVEEVINLFALAIRSGISAPDLKETICAYPSHSSDVQYMV